MDGEDEHFKIDIERTKIGLRNLYAAAENEEARKRYRMLLEELERDASAVAIPSGGEARTGED